MVDSSMTYTFSIDLISKVDEKQYQGTFTTKKLSIKDMGKLGVRRTQLCNGLQYNPEKPEVGIDLQTYNINSMIAHLELALIETPPWWDLDSLTDIEVMSEVYGEVASFEETFPRRPGRDSKERGKKAKGKSDPSGVSEPMVVGEVQASLEP